MSDRAAVLLAEHEVDLVISEAELATGEIVSADEIAAEVEATLLLGLR
jgi:hypothetical protein